MGVPIDSSDVTKLGWPGRWLGAASLIAGPVLLLAGVLLRLPYPFFFPQQLTAYAEHATQMAAAYSLFLAGILTLWPGVVVIVQLIHRPHPNWALWGGSLVVFGLMARVFHAGIDHMAFQLVPIQGVEMATTAVSKSYGGFHVVAALNAAIVFGWIVLAIGAYRAGVLGIARAVALASMSALMLGVLKGSSPTSVVATGGLCIALVPTGFQLLRAEPAPAPRQILTWIAAGIALVSAMLWIGRMG